MTTIRFGMLASAWTVAAMGILQLRNVRFEHALCLPGRCGPPLGAILSMHLFWLLGVMTAAAAVLYFMPMWPLRRIGLWLILLSVIGMAIVIGIDYAQWPPAPHMVGKPEVTSLGYHVHRFFFPIITMTDVPWMQVALGGALLLLVSSPKQTSPAAVAANSAATHDAETHQPI